MIRSVLSVSAALAVSVGLLLTACGGAGSGGNDKIQPSAAGTTGTTTSPSSIPSPTRTSGLAAPGFDLPSDITVDFRGFVSSDPKKQAVLTDATYAAKSVLEFEAMTYTKETPNFKRFWTGLHGAQFADSIISQGKDGSVITGLYSFYKPVVKFIAAGNVSVRYCEDQRKAYAKDARTGRVKVTTPSLSDFHLWTLLMKKGPAGDWQVFDHAWVKGAKQCEVA
ncbi:hypothetical protein [Actinomadura coerulea]|uniref:hypothetical protein n=1 Tax=Actinomadura coerulea TaxID=46159 RepID=UPI00342440BD